MDPVYAASRAADSGDPLIGVGAFILLAGALLVALAALAEHYSGRSNLVTRALDRWSR